MENYRNTDVMSRLAEKLTAKVADRGSDRPVFLELWTDSRAPSGFWNNVLSILGRFRSTVATRLTIRYSVESGYTLEGATWQQVSSRMGWTITDLATRIVSAINTEYELAHGWEISLNETLDELDSLEIA
tara:strand:+ start:113 stop:502 length:390 start_codon:yes stop_codon:yes gene_type:complete